MAEKGLAPTTTTSPKACWHSRGEPYVCFLCWKVLSIFGNWQKTFSAIANNEGQRQSGRRTLCVHRRFRKPAHTKDSLNFSACTDLKLVKG